MCYPLQLPHCHTAPAGPLTDDIKLLFRILLPFPFLLLVLLLAAKGEAQRWAHASHPDPRSATAPQERGTGGREAAHPKTLTHPQPLYSDLPPSVPKPVARYRAGSRGTGRAVPSPLLLRPFEDQLGGLHAGVLRHVGPRAGQRGPSHACARGSALCRRHGAARRLEAESEGESERISPLFSYTKTDTFSPTFLTDTIRSPFGNDLSSTRVIRLQIAAVVFNLRFITQPVVSTSHQTKGFCAPNVVCF